MAHMFRNEIFNSLLNHIQSKLNMSIRDVSTVSGGDINEIYRLSGDNGSYLLKVNDSYNYPNMFAREQEGLSAIGKTNTISVPDVILQSEVNNKSYLVLEWIDTSSGNAQSSSKLGIQLAWMHKNTSAQYGFHTDNYMGSLHQSNKRHDSWARFFVEERLQPMIKMAVDKKELNQSDVRKFNELYKKLPGLFTEEPPALLHGDLWSGNYLIDVEGKPYLIDPAVSYGNREFDIAMTTLFGGFDHAFYEAYNAEFPLLSDWQQRLKLWNLYPLLVHVNLFGGMYAKQVRDNLSVFV